MVLFTRIVTKSCPIFLCKNLTYKIAADDNIKQVHININD